MHLRLCARLGVPSPDHLYELLTSRQLREWEALYAEEPIALDDVTETVARGFAVTTNMIAMVGGNPNPHHKPAMFRPVSGVAGKRAKTVHASMTLADIAKGLGGMRRA